MRFKHSRIHETDTRHIAGGSRRLRDRSVAEVLLMRASHLSTPDRALVECVLGGQQSVAQIARSVGAPIRPMRSRLRRIIARLGSPEFLFVVRSRDAWSPLRQRVADLCFVRGFTVYEAAEELRVSRYSVRRHRESILALMNGGAA